MEIAQDRISGVEPEGCATRDLVLSLRHF